MAGPYGLGSYGYDGYKGDLELALHYYALRKMFPLPVNTDSSGAFDQDLHIEGRHLDYNFYSGMDLFKEFFADSFDQLRSDWKSQWALDSTVITDMQVEATAKSRVLVNKDSRLNPSYYVNLAAGFGYDSTVIEHTGDVFIVGSTIPYATPLSHTLYERTQNWIWDMTQTSGPTDPTIRAQFEKLIEAKKPAFTLVRFGY